MIHGTIHADGLAWPAQTYLEALGFRELDRFDPPYLDAQVRVVVIDRELVVRPAQYASSIDWSDAIAFRPLEYTAAAVPCRLCGYATLSPSDDICPDCDSTYDFEWVC